MRLAGAAVERPGLVDDGAGQLPLLAAGVTQLRGVEAVGADRDADARRDGEGSYQPIEGVGIGDAGDVAVGELGLEAGRPARACRGAIPVLVV